MSVGKGLTTGQEPYRNVSRGFRQALRTADCLGPCHPCPPCQGKPVTTICQASRLSLDKGCFYGHVSNPEPTAPRSCVHRRGKLQSLRSCYSLPPARWEKMFSFPLRKTLPMVTNLTPAAGGDKSPVGVREEQRVAARL